MDFDFGSLSVDRLVDFPDELKKSRRNLIAFSTVAIALLGLKLHVSKLTVFGIDMPIADSVNIYSVLAICILYESLMFSLRLFSFLLKNNYISWVMHLEKIWKIYKDGIPKVSDSEVEVSKGHNEFINSFWFRMKPTAIIVVCYFSEIVVPFVIGAYALYILFGIVGLRDISMIMQH